MIRDSLHNQQWLNVKTPVVMGVKQLWIGNERIIWNNLLRDTDWTPVKPDQMGLPYDYPGARADIVKVTVCQGDQQTVLYDVDADIMGDMTAIVDKIEVLLRSTDHGSRTVCVDRFFWKGNKTSLVSVGVPFKTDYDPNTGGYAQFLDWKRSDLNWSAYKRKITQLRRRAGVDVQDREG